MKSFHMFSHVYMYPQVLVFDVFHCKMHHFTTKIMLYLQIHCSIWCNIYGSISNFMKYCNKALKDEIMLSKEIMQALNQGYLSLVVITYRTVFRILLSSFEMTLSPHHLLKSCSFAIGYCSPGPGFHKRS